MAIFIVLALFQVQPKKKRILATSSLVERDSVQQTQDLTKEEKPEAINKKNARTQTSVSLNWEEFKDKYGEHLDGIFGAEGVLLSIQNTKNLNSLSQSGYSSKNREDVLRKANEIIDALTGLLGIQKSSPLLVADLQLGEVSSQVYFRQQLDGVPLYPMGSVSVDLGSRGELLGLSSSYVKPFLPSNERSLNEQEAVRRSGLSLPLNQGQAVIWISSLPTGNSLGRSYYAYQYQTAGRQTVIDASNGEVIYNRDRRQF